MSYLNDPRNTDDGEEHHSSTTLYFSYFMQSFQCLLIEQEFVKLLNLKAGEHVLDVGAGIGGGEFYMAQVSN